MPIAFGVLTTDTQEQAEERAGHGRDNKGWEAAAAAIEMAELSSAHRCGAPRRASVDAGRATGPMTVSTARGRRRAREAALQMLYQMGDRAQPAPREAILTYWPRMMPRRQVPNLLRQFANALVRGTMQRVGEIDAVIAAQAQNWRVERMAVIDRMVLRLAIYETARGAGDAGEGR